MSQSHLIERRSGRQNPVKNYSTREIAAARAQAQRAKLEAQVQAHKTRPRSTKKQARRANQDQRATGTSTTLAEEMAAYLHDHEGGNHSQKTLEWHTTALGLLRCYLAEEQEITQVEEVDAAAISG